MRRNPHLIEISAWPWLERLSRQHGSMLTLGTVPEQEWNRIAALGMDAVYLMGVWTRSATGRLLARTDRDLLAAYDAVLPGWTMADVPGSPYSIQAYEPDPRMGGWPALDRARQALAARGMALVLDFVPNHTGFDHAWVRDHPEFYVRGTLADYRSAPDRFHTVDGPHGPTFIACGRDPYFPPWRDVAQLNYFNPATREAMLGVLGTIAAHCDGVRCDMAMLVLNDVFAATWAGSVDLGWRMPDQEFWPAATAAVPMVYLAEVYWDREWQLQQQGFDYTYDKRLLDRLLQGDGEAVTTHLRADAAFAARLARFLENHDEERAAPAFGMRLAAAAAITYLLPGLRFFFDGQFEGVPARAPVQLGRWPDTVADPSVRALYDRILALAGSRLLHDGAWQLVDVQPDGNETYRQLVAFRWGQGDDWAIVVANPSARAASGRLVVDLPHGVDAVRVADALDGGRVYTWRRDSVSGGVPIGLDAGTARAFRPVSSS